MIGNLILGILCLLAAGVVIGYVIWDARERRP